MSLRVMNNLENYKAIADGIATLYYPHAEVIIHDARTHAILHVSGRQEGIISISHHENPNRGAERIRSITSVLKNNKGEPEALLCINVNFSALDTAVALLTHFLMPRQISPGRDSWFQDDWQKRINTFIQRWLRKHNLTLEDLNRHDRSMLVEALHMEGAFDGKYAADFVASELKMSRASIFNQLRSLRNSI
jgi:predicted transcriptional regulator YheO